MTVHLVGAGPGDPELLTLKAVRLLEEADVVVYDRLVDERVLALAAPWARFVDVGKVPGAPADSQQRINERLVALGRRFGQVVRLKGGDPFVFGRGGEEAEALRAAGIAVDVVPGVSSAIAAPAMAGIPVTLRGVSSGFTVVTAHQDPSTDDRLDWGALARLGTTLVVLMGASRAGAVADRLIAGGMPADTPVAVVTSATLPDQHVTRTELGALPTTPVASPSVIVIGEVAAARVLDPVLAELGPTLQGAPA
jgi:uroporphyrin-III C-methyltransferase